MRIRCAIFILTLLSALLLRAAQYTVVYSDGVALTGDKLINSYNWSNSTNTPSIVTNTNVPLARAGVEIRTIRELHRRAELNGPYIRLANGDVLPAVPTEILPADEEQGLPRRMLVQLMPPCRSYYGNDSEVTIRIDRIVAIVGRPEVASRLKPSTLMLKDGSTLTFKSARWSEEGLKLLTRDGIERVALFDIDSFMPRAVDAVAAMLEDAATPSIDPDDRLVQFELVNGARLTGKRMLLVEVGGAHVALQPSWAFSGIYFNTDKDVVSRSYRDAREIPLSLLSVEAIEQRSFTGFLWPWQRNRTVRGEALASGDVRAALGFGTHAYSALAVELPEGAQTFSTWVGLDQVVGEGGCVQCAIYGDTLDKPPLWKSDFMRGNQTPQRIEGLDVSKCSSLILVTDYAHEGRPSGADPFDIRDEVSWLDPVVDLPAVTESAIPETWQDARILEQLPSWVGGEALIEEPQLRPSGVTWWNMWRPGLLIDLPEEMKLTRQVAVSTTNAWFQVAAGRGREGRGGHLISLHINGARHQPRGWQGHEEGEPVRRWEDLLTSKRGAE